jgi:hypothetical protein
MKKENWKKEDKGEKKIENTYDFLAKSRKVLKTLRD